MEPTDEHNGAAGLMGMWKSVDGYNGSDSYIILSGGDMWTGPAISTWYEGESMVEVMNAMDYDAAAIGNHEFDFTIDGLNQRLQEMTFPLLAANITYKDSGETPSFALPYVIKESNGVKVGIIGLASVSTSYTTFPAYVEDLDFTSYEDAINKYAPMVEDDGAEVIIIIGHICEDEMESLVPIAKTNGVSIIGGGHCNDLVTRVLDGVLLISTDSYMKGYVKVNLDYNKTTREVNFDNYTYVSNQNNYSDSEVNDIVEIWQSMIHNELSEVIGYCSETIPKTSVEMGNMVTDSWRYTFPDANISITNSGGIRQDINEGDVSLETIVGLLPFNNSIIQLELTGTELLDCIGNLLLGGMTTIGGNFLSNGSPIEPDIVYTVLTTDYLYSVPATSFSDYDSSPEYTYVHYRQPLIEWIKSLNTSEDNPLNNYLDYTPRN